MMFKEGDSSVVRGVKCDFIRIELAERPQYKIDGWADNEKELKEAKEEASKDSQETEEEAVLNPVRIAAKEAGIGGWDTKRIKTLEKELE
jgi:hypothetical protein